MMTTTLGALIATAVLSQIESITSQSIDVLVHLTPVGARVAAAVFAFNVASIAAVRILRREASLTNGGCA